MNGFAYYVNYEHQLFWFSFKLFQILGEVICFFNQNSTRSTAGKADYRKSFVLFFWSQTLTTYSTRNKWFLFIVHEISTVTRKCLVWPQWWSFADVSQQGVDFSKKISKITIIFWSDFHRCSHGLSKIRHHFRNKSHSILKL